jgi:DNA-binding transcriptional MerR regulator
VTSAAPQHARMSIGEVLGLLRADFPDVTISKIRYLESEGLVEPARTPSGYRKFTHADVERLRYVLTRQRDSYYPLKRIREELATMDRGLPPVDDDAMPVPPRMVLAGDGYPAPETFAQEGRPMRLSRVELLASAGIDGELLDQIERYGLIERHRSQAAYDGTALVIAQTVGELAAYGLEPRHLRAFKTAADREVGLVEQVVAPLARQRDATAEARADDTVRQLAALTLRLHAMLVKNGLRR